MRARYSAYAVGDVAFIVNTTHPAGPHFQPDRAAWLQEVAQFCRRSRFEGLRVLESSTDGDRGEVTFHATIFQGKADRSFSERSLFLREGGRWYYHSGTRA